MSRSNVRSPLSELLQDVTESLAAARTQEEVLTTVLGPALTALGVVSGRVWVVSGAQLDVVASQGEEGLWTETLGLDGPLTLLLDGPSLPAQALRQHEARFEVPVGPATAAPDRDVAASLRATAILPMYEGQRPLGVLALLFEARPEFTWEERRFLRTLSAQCGIALGRAQLTRELERRVQQRTRQLKEEAAAQAAFVAFSESVGTQTDVLALAWQAITVLRAHFADASIGYAVPDGEHWKLLAWSDDGRSGLVGWTPATLTGHSALIAQALHQGQTVFTDATFTEDRTALPADQAERAAWFSPFNPVSHSPLIVGGALRGLLSVRFKTAGVWRERDQALIRAISRSLTLALERADQTAQLEAQNAELEARTRALDAFAHLTRNLTYHTEPGIFIEQAQAVALSLIPDGMATYYELDGEVWRMVRQTGDARSEGLQQVLDQGLPRDTHSLLTPWQTGQPLYQDRYPQGIDTQASVVAHIRTGATLPVMQYGQPAGIFAVALFEQRDWSATDRVVLETLVRSLGLALERAEAVRQLDEERAALATFTAFTETVGTTTDVLALVHQAMHLLQTAQAVDVSYFERDGPRFRARVWTEGLPDELLERFARGFSLQQPSVVQAAQERQAIFVDHWDSEAQGLAEAALYRSVALQPFFRSPQDSELSGMLIMASRQHARWTERDKGIFRAVGRSLSLALDRAEQERQLRVQRDILDGRTQALSAANEELEAFAYSVSHDLRTPVRHITSFNTLLRKALLTYSDVQQDAKVSRYLTVVDQAAERMDTLIDAMLDLSRTSRLPLRVVAVDLAQVVQTVQAELEPEVQGREVAWEIGPLPQVMGDLTTLRQVMVNLLSNALKFTRLSAQARVSVWAEERPGEWAVFVQDNGVGFDPRYQDKLFGVFQRLHRHEEFEGTGVGLANVRRIIARHGGTLSARSQPGEGATFGFTLPRPLAAPLTALPITPE